MGAAQRSREWGRGVREALRGGTEAEETGRWPWGGGGGTTKGEGAEGTAGAKTEGCREEACVWFTEEAGVRPWRKWMG